MIDTDKYEGTWKFYGMDYWKHRYEGGCEADTNLIHDAPLLLAEVKRLQHHLNLMIEKFGEAYLIETLIERGER
tara:strand:+ start:319 stop:540 length:222 start_codon:yes stop_codon:yes gene_type:complete